MMLLKKLLKLLWTVFAKRLMRQHRSAVCLLFCLIFVYIFLPTVFVYFFTGPTSIHCFEWPSGQLRSRAGQRSSGLWSSAPPFDWYQSALQMRNYFGNGWSPRSPPNVRFNWLWCGRYMPLYGFWIGSNVAWTRYILYLENSQDLIIAAATNSIYYL